MTAKETYNELCGAEGCDVPLFLQYWWMDTVCCGKEWDVALVYDNQGQVIGAMPYLIASRMGMRYVLQPQLTQYNGPWYHYPEGMDESRRLSFERMVADQLLAQLDKLHLAYYQQNFSPAVTDWLPFYWQGYSQTTRYTYRIDDISNMDQVFARFDSHYRQKKILQAEKQLTADTDISPECFADYHAAYWKQRGASDLLTKEFIVRVCWAAIERGQGVIMAARDHEGTLQGARFVVWDSHSAYSLLSALNYGQHPNGTSAYLFWQLLQYLQGKTRAFDFEGSMDKNIEQSYRLYGASQHPYFQISKCRNPLFGLLLRLKRR